MILLMLLLAQEVLPEGHHGAAVNVLELSPDGKRLVTGGWVCGAKVWDASTLKLLWATEESSSQLLSAAFAPDSALLASIDGQGPVRLWASGKLVRTFVGLQGGIAEVAFTPDGRRIVAVSHRGELFVWTVADGHVVLKRETKLGFLESLALSPAGDRWAWGSNDGLRIVDVTSGESRLVAGPAAGSIVKLAFSSDGTHLAVSRADDTIQVLDSKGGSRIKLVGPRGRICGLAISRDNRCFAAGDNESEARAWRIEGPERILTIQGVGRAFTGLAFSPDGKVLFIAEGDGRIRAKPLGTAR